MNIDGIKNALGDLLAKLPIERFRDPPPVVGVLRFDGVIGRSAGPGRQGLGLASHERAIAKLFERKNLKAVALVINSPGGSPVQSALIAQRIRDLAAEKELPLVSFCEDVAASGGYWLACAGDEIFADANSIVGSIGVISAGFGFPDLIERFGIERRVYATGQRKGMLDPFQDEKAEDVDRLHELHEDIFENFKPCPRPPRRSAESRRGHIVHRRYLDRQPGIGGRPDRWARRDAVGNAPALRRQGEVPACRGAPRASSAVSAAAECRPSTRGTGLSAGRLGAVETLRVIVATL